MIKRYFSRDQERDWIRRLEAVDKTAFDLIYRRYRRGLITAASKILGDADAAEDIIQGVFFKLWEEKENFSSINGSVEGWLRKVVKNACLTYLRSAVAGKARNWIYLSEINNIGEEFDQAHHMELIERALDALSSQQATVFRMFKLQGKSQRDIAIELHISENTVRNHVFEANKRVKDFISKMRT